MSRYLIGSAFIILVFFCFKVIAEPLSIGLIYTISEFEDLKKAQTNMQDPLREYSVAIEHHGNKRIALSQKIPTQSLNELISRLDGLIIPGGDDVDPRFYNESPVKEIGFVDREFDLFEMDVYRKARERQIPIMGICKGEQLINVTEGGSLYQDIPTQLKGSQRVVHRKRVNGSTALTYHNVDLERDSTLFKLFKSDRIKTNSFHHQGVKVLAPGFKAMARAEDGLIEAYESIKGSPVLAVQFHPELMREHDPKMEKLFETFFKKVKVNSVKSKECLGKTLKDVLQN